MTVNTLPERDRVICPCTELTLGGLINALGRSPRGNFDSVLQITGAGSRCTACLLDLEYFFVQLAASGQMSAIQTDDAKLPLKSIPLRRRLWGALDRRSPNMGIGFADIAPILYGEGYETRIRVSNDGRLFDGTNIAPPVVLRAVVRDAEGRVRHRGLYRAEPGGSVDIPASQFLRESTADDNSGVPRIGSLTMRRSFASAGRRGTTRPQIVIASPRGMCAVHTQTFNAPGRRSFVWINRPGDDRIFVSMVNYEGTETTFHVSTAIVGLSPSPVPPKERTVRACDHGAFFLEIEPPDGAADGSTLITRVEVDGRHKLHFFAADPAMTTISIDHM